MARRKTSDQIKKEIDKLEAEYQEALKYEQNLESGSRIAVATALHEMLCTLSHEDQCSWDYGSWEKPSDARTRWLKRADKFIALKERLKISFNDMLDVIKASSEWEA